MKIAVALLVLGAVTVMAQQEQEWCDKIEPLGPCTEDQGDKRPQHLQPVYLGYNKGPGWWVYPAFCSRVKRARHDIRTIMNTKGSWAQWIWHDCGNGYVCLESGRYPNYYMYAVGIGIKNGFKIAYSSAPKSEEWTKFKITQERTTDRGIYMFMVRKKYVSSLHHTGLAVYIYIPPRCEGYRQVVNHSNRSPVPVNHNYVLQRGITRTETTSKTTRIGIGVTNEIVLGVLAGGFSLSWTQETSKAFQENEIHEMSTTIPPGMRLIKWQKVVTYGPFEWRSGVEFVTCMKEINPQFGQVEPRIQISGGDQGLVS